MFKFDFKLDDDDEVEGDMPVPVLEKPAASSNRPSRPCHSISLDELCSTLPQVISYSSLRHSSLPEPILRRDLFDARFQLAQNEDSTLPLSDQRQEEGKLEEPDEFVDANTDLIPGTYEGGLKTWEGGVDLVEVLITQGGDFTGKRILEVGCGTAVPSAYILRSLLSTPKTSLAPRTILHLQDYNSLVLSLVTLPNLILSSLSYLPPTILAESQDVDVDEAAQDQLEGSGSLSLSPPLLKAFKQLLEERNIELKFTYGDWTGMAHRLIEEQGLGDRVGYDLVLTAETIYAEDSVESLIDVLHSATVGSIEPRILVAAKVLYFGVGGDIIGFLRRVSSRGGSHELVKEWTTGVGRKVISISWTQSS